VSASESDQQASIARLADAIYSDKVRRARAQDPVQKLLDGFTLFEAGLELTKIDVARTLGTSDATAVNEALQRRFDRVRQVRAADLYRALECGPMAHVPR
jgi:hypothetical protein